ncbi:hypothetical protein IJU85_00435 [Candidatus Saccharibacteria bacterium]|nr:hypothetical protein [Candidatus Saccharibacteria bacterium]
MNETLSNKPGDEQEGINPAEALAEMPSFEEHMEEQADQSAETAEQAKERLETRRQKYIDTYTSFATRRLFANSKSGEDIDRRIFRVLNKDIPYGNLDRSRSVVKSIVSEECDQEWNGQVFPTKYPTFMSLELAKLAYKVGCLTIAGSERGVDTAAKMNLEYDSEAHPPVRLEGTLYKYPDARIPDAINIDNVDSKDARLIQIGAGVIKESLQKSIAKQIKRFTPEFDK